MSATTRTVELGFGFTAEITTEISGEGNALTTFVTTNLGGFGRKMKVEHSDDSLTVEPVGEWEAASMAALLRALANAVDARTTP